eukprot:TRINITY_DN9001_c0_g1_i4.p1 TRINITY_DN9001_c0_g1~~TRINITY_DN9001_c0_g1_i4.p1  ORF type:complete len:2096 (-),score=171.35 TRINITY_DN9001_c0_g1_i4:376-5826(-)
MKDGHLLVAFSSLVLKIDTSPLVSLASSSSPSVCSLSSFTTVTDMKRDSFDYSSYVSGMTNAELNGKEKIILYSVISSVDDPGSVFMYQLDVETWSFDIDGGSGYNMENNNADPVHISQYRGVLVTNPINLAEVHFIGTTETIMGYEPQPFSMRLYEWFWNIITYNSLSTCDTVLDKDTAVISDNVAFLTACKGVQRAQILQLSRFGSPRMTTVQDVPDLPYIATNINAGRLLPFQNEWNYTDVYMSVAGDSVSTNLPFTFRFEKDVTLPRPLLAGFASIYGSECGVYNPFDSFYYYIAYTGVAARRLIVRLDPDGHSHTLFSNSYGRSLVDEVECTCTGYAADVGKVTFAESCFQPQSTTGIAYFITGVVDSFWQNIALTGYYSINLPYIVTDHSTKYTQSTVQTMHRRGANNSVSDFYFTYAFPGATVVQYSSLEMGMNGAHLVHRDLWLKYLDMDSNGTNFYAASSGAGNGEQNGTVLYMWNRQNMIDTNTIQLSEFNLIPGPDVQQLFWREQHPSFPDVFFYLVKRCAGGTWTAPSLDGTCPIWIVGYDTSHELVHGPWDLGPSVKGKWDQPHDGKILLFEDDVIVLHNIFPSPSLTTILLQWDDILQTWSPMFDHTSYNFPQFTGSFLRSFSSSHNNASGSSQRVSLFIPGSYNPVVSAPDADLAYLVTIPHLEVYSTTFDLLAYVRTSNDTPFSLVFDESRLKWNEEDLLDVYYTDPEALPHPYGIIVYSSASAVKFKMQIGGKFEWMSSAPLPRGVSWSYFSTVSQRLYYVSPSSSSKKGTTLGVMDASGVMTSLTSVTIPFWDCAQATLDAFESILYLVCKDSDGLLPVLSVLAAPLSSSLSPFTNTTTANNTSSSTSFSLSYPSVISLSQETIRVYPTITTSDQIPSVVLTEMHITRYLFFLTRSPSQDTLCQISAFDLRSLQEVPSIPFVCGASSPVGILLDEDRGNLYINTVAPASYRQNVSPHNHLQIIKYNVDCYPGMYRNRTLDTCVPSPPGFYTPYDGYSFPIACPTKTYAASSASSECIACPSGSFNDKTGQFECKKCSAGTFSSVFSDSCSSCAAGTYSLEDRTGCANCLAGTFCDRPGCSNCTLCPTGSVSLGLGAAHCTQCEAGSIPRADGAACVLCPAGSSAKPGDSLCTLCPAGTYAAQQGSTSCIQCEPGTKSSVQGSSSCEFCEAGTFTPEFGSLSCTSCPKGTFSAPGNFSRPSCSACLPGTYTDVLGSTSCTKCASGSYTSVPGSLSCLQCDTYTYINMTGQAACRSCQPNARGSNDSISCECLPTFYPKMAGGQVVQYPDSATPCVTCPDGAECYGGTDVRALPGYWRDDVISMTFYACPGASCLGGASSVCEEGYAGPLCAVCTPGFGQKVNECVKCNPQSVAVGWVILVGVFVVFLALMFRPPSNSQAVFAKIKILVSFLQVISQITSTYQVKWPGEFSTFVGLLAFVNLDLLKMTSLDCAIGLHVDFYTTYILQMILPLCLSLLITIIFIVWILLHRRGWLPRILDKHKQETIIDMLVRNQLFILVLLYPGVSTKILAIFKCRDVSGTFLHEEDFSIQCYTSTWYIYMVVSSIMCCVWIAGVPALFLSVLVRFRMRLDDKSITSRIGFLYYPYRPLFFFWEVPELIRRLFLTAVVNFVGRGTATQFVVAMMLSLLSMLAQLICLPFSDASNNWLQLLSLFAIFFTLFYGLLAVLGAFSLTPIATQRFLTFLLIFVNVIVILGLVISFVPILRRLLQRIYNMWRRRRANVIKAITPPMRARSWGQDADIIVERDEAHNGDDDAEDDDDNYNRSSRPTSLRDMAMLQLS